MNLLDKITQLKDYFLGKRADSQDVSVIDSWMAEAKRLLILKSLKDHDGIKFVLKIFLKDIKDINETLLTNRSLKDDERLRLMDKRALAQQYLDLFTPIDYQLEQLEQKVDSEL